MKKYVLLLAILVLPGLAMGQPTLDVFPQGGSPTPGLITYDPRPGNDTQIVFDVHVDGITPMGGLQYSVAIDAQANDADWLLNNVVQKSFMMFMGGAMTWAPSLVGAPMNIVNATTAEGYMGGCGPGQHLAEWTLDGVNAQLIPKIGTIQIVQADIMVWPGNGIDQVPFVGAGISLPVQIVPEPASVLLLLGALPFLRRRR